MGSFIEFNDTLQLTSEQGFPAELDVKIHFAKPFTEKDFSSKLFSFKKPNIRIYHPAPVRVFLAHNIDGKWLHWGKAHIVEQTIHAESKETSGKFRIVKIYDPEYMKQKNLHDVEEENEFSEFP